MKISLKEYDVIVERFKELGGDVEMLDDALKAAGYDNAAQQQTQAVYSSRSDERKMRETGKTRYELYYKDRYTQLAEESGLSIGEITRRGGVQRAKDIIEARKIT